MQCAGMFRRRIECFPAPVCRDRVQARCWRCRRSRPARDIATRHGGLCSRFRLAGAPGAHAVRPRSSSPLSQQQTAPYIALCGCTVTIVSEDSPYCGQSGRVRRVFWRQRVPWVVLRLRLGGIVALPWASTDLLVPQLEIDPRTDEAATALRDLARFLQHCHPCTVEVKNNSMLECFAVFLRVTESAPPMSRRQITNRREVALAVADTGPASDRRRIRSQHTFR